MRLKIVVFIGLTFICTIILAVIQQFSNFDSELITLPQLAPALGYLFTIFLFKDIFVPIKIGFNKIVLLKLVFCVFVPFVLFTIIYYLGKLFCINVQINNKLSSIIFLILFSNTIGSIGEEIGWRSFFQPLLELKYSKIVSSIIVGLTWGLWHINHYKNGPLFMFGFLLFTISASIIIVYILKNTQNNILLSSLFHGSINIWFRVFFENNITNVKIFIINGIIWLIPAIIILMLNKKYYLNTTKNK
jgi:membrane protease YdiL (CAAX protease family)